MNSVFEINTVNNVTDVATDRVKKTSPIVEVFSALASGKTPSVDGKLVDKAVNEIKEISSRAMANDPVAVSEMNAIIRFAIEPKLLERIRLFDFMGSFKRIGFNEAPYMRTYNYESVDSRFQASSGDVPFAALNYREYPIATQCISGGFAVDYRELQAGNFDGSVAEGMAQVQTDMMNKATYYVIAKLYDALKNAKGVKHFAESSGIAKTAVDDMLKVMRRYGKVAICGDYSVVSQLNGFAGFQTVDAKTVRFGSEALTDEINKTGLISMYNGAAVVETPNALNWTKMNADKSSYELYMPEGLMFFIPKGNVSPLQIFQRGGMTTMTGEDIVTRQHLTRFDIEIGAGVAEGMEDQIGLLSDTNFAVPTL